MATTAVIPAASPASAAAPVASASPSPVSSPAAAATPVTTPVTPSPAANVELTPEQRQSVMVEAFDKSQKAAGIETSPEAPKVETPKVETPKAEETPKVETPAAEADDAFSLTDDSFAGARDLAAELDAVAGLSGLLPKETRDKIMANARIAERLAPYQELFASPEEAKVISETANEHASFAEAYSMISRDPEKGTNAFVNKLIEGSALRNEDGSIRKNANGDIMTDGTAATFFKTIFERGFALNITKKVEALKDENLTAAFDLVMERVGLRPSTADQDQNADPGVVAQKAALAAERAQIANERNTQHTETMRTHQAAVDGETTSAFTTSLGGLMGQATALSALEQTAVRGNIEKAFATALKRGNPASVAYYRELDRIRQSPISAGRRQKEVALAARFTREKLVTLARPILKEAGVVVGQKAEERAAAQAARAEQARSEVSGGRAPAASTAGPGDGAAQEARAIEAFKAANSGRAPVGESELRIGMMLAHAKQRGIAA